MDQIDLKKEGFTEDQINKLTALKQKVAAEEAAYVDSQNQLAKNLERAKEVAEKHIGESLQKSVEIIKNIEQTKKLGKPAEALSYGQQMFIDANLPEREKWTVFDEVLNPLYNASELDEESLTRRQVRSIVLSNLGFTIVEAPPYSLTEPQLINPKWIGDTKIIYYAQAPSRDGVYLVRTVEKQTEDPTKYTLRENIFCAPTEQSLGFALGVPVKRVVANSLTNQAEGAII